MARTNRAETARRTATAVRNNRGMYVDGNTARRLQEVPARRNRPPQVKRKRTEARKRELAAAQTHKLSKETQRNREKAMNMNLGFVIFLALVSAAVLFFCINSLGEGYITTVGCQFTVYFFLTQGIVYSLRMGWISINHLEPLFFKQKRV